MRRDNHLIDDLARVASGALGALGGVREDIESKLQEVFQRFVDDMDLVTREEFEAVRMLAQNAREESERLSEQVASLEKQLKGFESRDKSPKQK